MKAVILACGRGSKVWPYNRCRHKTMIPIGNKPIVHHQVEGLRKAGISDIIIVGDIYAQEIKHYFRKDNMIKVIELEMSKGSAHALLQIQNELSDEFIVLYGDCLFDEYDLIQFVDSKKDIFISPLHSDAKEMICTEISGESVKQFWGHPRGENWKYFACAFHLYSNIFKCLETVQDTFQSMKVGVGSPHEQYLENALNDMLDDGEQLQYMVSENQVFDIDKPWQILEANQYYNNKVTSLLSSNIVDEGSQISEHAKIQGHIILGKDSYIGDHVLILGNVIIGDRTVIDNGAIVGNGTIIGDDCHISNHCKIGEFCSIGNECIVDHTSELIGGILFSKVYLYHYGEYYGILGRNTDIGAGTTVGTLRFDDGETVHCLKGRKYIPLHYSNACFIGDYSRTGVASILLPGCKIGYKSVVGSGVILNEDVEDETLIYPKQELVKVPWGDSKYGW